MNVFRIRSRRALLGAVVAITALSAGAARAQSCPVNRLPADNGSPFSACQQVPANPKQAVNKPADAFCPLAADARVRDIVIDSVAINNKPMRTRIILPKSYLSDPNPNRKWPVLYLLTGHGASYESWTCATKLRQYVENLEVLVVMPEGTVGVHYTANAYTPDGLSGFGVAASGVPSWYSDWRQDLVKIQNYTVYGPQVRMRIRTHHTQELRQVLNKNFRADNSRYAVAGLSMGGYGATAYALTSNVNQPWIAAAAFSGMLDTEYASAGIPFVGGFDAPTVVRGSIEGAQAAQGEYLLTGNRLWGEKTDASWRQNNVRRLAAGTSSVLSSIPFYVSAGQGTTQSHIDLVARYNDGTLDPLEVGAYFTTQSFLNALTRTQPGLTTEFFPTGGHNWKQWDVNICRALSQTLVPVLDAAHPVALASCPTL